MKARVGAIPDKLGLAHLAARFPDQLSGGQQQRLAICRALVYEPKVLLLDEPLSNRDAKLREEARFSIRKLILDLKICAIIVTHDQGQALAIADSILLLKGAAIVQEGSPTDIYGAPQSFYAADFMGANNVLKGALAEDSRAIAGEGWRFEGVWRDAGAPADASDIRAVVRVEAVEVAERESEGSAPFDLEGGIYLGDRWEYRLRRGGVALRAQGRAALAGPTVHCRLPADATWLFDP